MQTKPFIEVAFTIKNDQLCSGTTTFNVAKGRLIGELTRTVLDGEDLIDKTAVFWEDDKGNTYGNEVLTVEELTDMFNSCCVGEFELLMRTFTGNTTTDYDAGVFDVEGNFLGIATTQQELLDLWNAVPANAALGVLQAGSTPTTFIINSATPPDDIRALAFVQFPLLNFNDDPVPGFPVGLFLPDQTFVSNASTMAAVATQWNLNATLTVAGDIIAIDTGDVANLGLLLNDEAVVIPDARTQRFWFINVTSGTPSVYLSGVNRVRKANGTVGLASVIGTLGVVGATSFGTNTTSLGNGGTIDLVDATSVFYKVVLSVGTNYFYHNEDGEWAWMDVFALVSNNGGNLPPTVRFLAIQSFGTNNTTANLSVNNFTNVATALNNVETAEYNGLAIDHLPANTRVDLMPNLKHFLIFETGGAAVTWTFASFGFSLATHPDLLFIGIRRNNSVARLVSFTGPDITGLSQLTKGFDLQGGRLIDSAAVDAYLIAMGTLLAASVAVATAKITLTQNPLRTVASDAAVTAIELLGYDVQP